MYGPAREAGKERVILDGEKERQGDFVFTASEAGEYRFCFDNNMSTISDKLVDFEISVRSTHSCKAMLQHQLTKHDATRSRTKSAPHSPRKLVPVPSSSPSSKRRF